jgi:hypothetical protein
MSSHYCPVCKDYHHPLVCPTKAKEDERDKLYVVSFFFIMLAILLIAGAIYGQWVYGNWKCGMPSVNCRTIVKP